MNVPLSKPFIGEEEIQAVTAVLRSDRLALGPKTQEFEDQFVAMTGCKYAVAVNSGTSGLHLAIRALGIGPGDEVITSPFSFIASSNCILFEGATPVFVDVEEGTFTINPSLIEAAITPRTKAIIPVHVFGECCKMDVIMDIARRHNLFVIEDTCESIDAKYKGKVAGNFGDIAVYGFYPNKQITTGEGGMIVTSDEKLYKLCLSLRNQGRGDSMEWLTHVRLGYNYRISEMTAALGVEQMKKLPYILKRRREVAQKYKKALMHIPEITLPTNWWGDDFSWFVFAIRVNEKIRDSVLAFLNDNGVQSKAYFSPCIHLQDFYIKQFGFQEGDFPLSEKLSRETLILPFYTELKDEEIAYVVKVFEASLEKVL